MATKDKVEVKEQELEVPVSTVVAEDGKEYVAAVDLKSLHKGPVVLPTDEPKLVVEPGPVKETPADEVVSTPVKAEDK